MEQIKEYVDAYDNGYKNYKDIVLKKIDAIRLENFRTI